MDQSPCSYFDSLSVAWFVGEQSLANFGIESEGLSSLVHLDPLCFAWSWSRKWKLVDLFELKWVERNLEYSLLWVAVRGNVKNLVAGIANWNWEFSIRTVDRQFWDPRMPDLAHIKGETLRLLETNSFRETFELRKLEFLTRLLERGYPRWKYFSQSNILITKRGSTKRKKKKIQNCWIVTSCTGSGSRDGTFQHQNQNNRKSLWILPGFITSPLH